MGVVEQHEANACMIERTVDRRGDMFFEKCDRVVIAGHFVDRLLERLSQLRVQWILRLAPLVDDVAEMECEITRRLVDLRNRRFPLALGRPRVLPP